MTSIKRIQRLANLAVHSFSRSSLQNGSHIEKIENVKHLANSITASDLNINPILLQDQGPYNPNENGAPVAYMEIYEDSNVTICVFILKNGVKMPLHDHPGMVGILKVIYGTVALQSYSKPQIIQQYPDGKENYSGIYSAVKSTRVEMGPDNPACHLTPELHNLHEISTVGGAAAFLDILAPPYGRDGLTGVERECHYYKEINSARDKFPPLPPESVYLAQVPSPNDFWCDHAKYDGPLLENVR